MLDLTNMLFSRITNVYHAHGTQNIPRNFTQNYDWGTGLRGWLAHSQTAENLKTFSLLSSANKS